MKGEIGPESDAPARVGQVLRDKYTLERVLGVGGMAAVYAASHRNGRKVAIKILHRELSVNKEVRERFLREGQAANAVGHTGAVAVLDDDVSEDGAAFLVMELLDGGSAEELSEARGGRLPLVDVCAIGDQLLDVLEAAQKNGIVHRDIKPANLFITRHGRLKVLDFGIAKLRQASGARATQTGLMLGTPAFMAPEQALGRVADIDARTDVWAVGSTLFALASGRSVHEAPTAQETLIYAATKPAPPFASVLPQAPAELGAVIDRALAFDREQRFPTAGAMREAWNQAARGVRSSASNLDTLSTLLQGFTPRASEMPGPMSGSTHFAGSAAKSAESAPAEGGARTRRLAVIGGVSALAILALAIAWALGSRSATENRALEANASSRPVNATAEPPPSPSVTVAVQEPAPATPEATPLPSARPGDTRPRNQRPAARPTKPGTTTEAPKPAAAPGKPNCTPPYDLDSQGVKIWKRGCF